MKGEAGRASLLAALGLLAALRASPAGAANACWADGRSSDKAEIAGVLARYGHYADARNDASLAELFTPDGTWEAAGIGRFAGTDELRRFIRNIPAGTRHVTANYAIDVAADGTATARSYVVMLGMDGGRPVIRGTGNYEDVLVRVGCAWKFKSRKYVAWRPAG
jgi:hypothetical protein